jgi:hypothetical protein
MSMGRQAEHTHTLPDKTRVGYSLTDRPGGFRVRFVGPDGKRVERATGSSTKGEARHAAADIIEREYRPVMPASRPRSTWDEALADLDRTPDLRPDSVRGYRTAVKALRKVLPNLAGPADVTPELAHRFKRDFLGGTYTRGKASDAATYKRSPESCRSYLRSLRSLWQKHLRPLGHVRDNPWLDVPYPNTPRGKRVRVPPEDVINEFFKWLTVRYPRWDLPRLFVTVKMLAGCRTIDLCLAKTSDLGTSTLTLRAEATKTREARTIPLPEDVVADLRKVAGPTWLWERSVEESKVHRPNPRAKGRTGYDPSTWRWTIQNLFREFNEHRAAKVRLRPHDLRARALTLVAAATQNVDAVCQAFGVDPQTARHYIDQADVVNGLDVLRKAADNLRPKK